MQPDVEACHEQCWTDQRLDDIDNEHAIIVDVKATPVRAYDEMAVTRPNTQHKLKLQGKIRWTWSASTRLQN